MEKIESNKEENKKKLLAMLKEAWARTKDMPEEEVKRIVDEAVKAVRNEKEALNKEREILVMALLRQGLISQGRAAELLEISRYDLFDLMAKYKIPVIDMMPDELERELKQAKEFFQDR